MLKIFFSQIQGCLHACAQPCYVGHINAHSGLPGLLTEGDAIADKAIQIIGLL